MSRFKDGIPVSLRILGRRVRVKFIRNLCISLVVFILISTRLFGQSTNLSQYKTYYNKQDLLDGIGMNEELQKIKNGEIYKVDPTGQWRTSGAVLAGSKPMIPETPPRCKIYTYFDGDVESPININDIGMLHVWKRAWYAFGFDPIVLDKSDAERHPRFKEFQAITSQESYKQANRKWFAWLVNGAGILSHYKVLPMVSKGEEQDTLDFLSACKFGYPTKYRLTDMDFVHGDANEAAGIINSIIRGDSQKLNDIFYMEEENALAYYSAWHLAQVTGSEIPERDIPILMNTHLHHSFLSRYEQGISIVDPFPEEADVFMAPAFRLAKRLATCPENPYSDTCPPTQTYLEISQLLKQDKIPMQTAARFVCANICSADSPLKEASIQTISSLPKVGSGSFTVVAMPHPLTMVSIMQNDPKVTALHSRKNLKRNPYLRQLTSTYIPNESIGSQYRLLLAKDAIYQLPRISDISWFIWEDQADQMEPQDELVEWDVGFGMTKSSSLKMALLAAPDEVSVATVLNSARDRVLGRTPDADKVAIEAWNMVDTEIWNFLRLWIKKRTNELSAVVFDLNL
jgi:hypothetical protein